LPTPLSTGDERWRRRRVQRIPLVLTETFLLGNDHFVHTLIKGRADVASRTSGRKYKM
jgi:hypothetical protein